MKRTLLITLCLLSSINILTAQTSLAGGYGFSDTDNVMVNNGLWIKNQPSKKEIKGSPYLFDNWNNNSQIYIKQKGYTLPLFNYNIKSERFEAKYAEDSILVINPRNVTKVVVNNKVFKRYLDPDFQRNSFFEELVNIEENSLVKKYQVRVKEGTLNPMTQQQISPDEYVKNELYYIKDNDNKLKRIKLKKAAVLSLIDSEKRNLIKEYSKENKLKFNKLEDVIRILNYSKTI